MSRKRMYLVKYEVIATSLKRALEIKGRVYEIVETDEKSWPVENKKVGFKKK